MLKNQELVAKVVEELIKHPKNISRLDIQIYDNETWFLIYNEDKYTGFTASSVNDTEQVGLHFVNPAMQSLYDEDEEW